MNYSDHISIHALWTIEKFGSESILYTNYITLEKKSEKWAISVFSNRNVLLEEKQQFSPVSRSTTYIVPDQMTIQPWQTISQKIFALIQYLSICRQSCKMQCV
jgi:hypothetical protein